VNGAYPDSVYYYDTEADTAINPTDGWCDYGAPSCAGRSNLDPIVNTNGLKMILASKREGQDMEPGVLGDDNKLSGEGPFRIVPPQKVPSPPDQGSTAANQDVIWPYDEDWDHNAGSSTRTVTIIRVEPLPEGTTDIDVLEAGWKYVDEEKVIVYGALADTNPPVADIKANGQDGPISVSSNDSISVTVGLAAGSRLGQNADWWVAAHESTLGWYSYVYASGSWVGGIAPCVQTGLLNLSPAVQIFNGKLPAGVYDFYFGVDSNADGQPQGTWRDSVRITVQ
jgi:hypothetical protein